MKEQNSGAYNEETFAELEGVLSRTRAKSNNRRLALKQLHKAHQLTILELQNMSLAHDNLLTQCYDLQAETNELRKELTATLKELSKQQPKSTGFRWWSRA